MGAACGPDGRWGEELLENMTFSWFYCPLIAHAMGHGAVFPAFPSASPRFAAWIDVIADTIANMPGNPAWHNIADARGHVDAAFQERMQDVMETLGYMDELNAMNVYALRTAEEACEALNAAGMPHV